MQLGMIGLGRMGSNMVLRLLANGHDCVVYDRNSDATEKLARKGAVAAGSLADLTETLQRPRAVWLMVSAAAVDSVVKELAPYLDKGDTIIDGGNSNYREGMRRAKALGEHGIFYLDVGTSGGVWGHERGYCLMIGGETEPVATLDPIFASLAPGRGEVEATPAGSSFDGADDEGTADKGYLHCGPPGAGHFVKMVHNGIEYGLMAAYAEGFNVLAHANSGKAEQHASAEETPLDDPEAYQFDLALPQIAEVWRRGSVIGSWLLDLIARALIEDPALEAFTGRVSDSGEGRWTLKAALDTAVPTPVLAAALVQRFSSRGENEFADRLLSALRKQFGGHHEGGRRSSSKAKAT
ncbi:MAG: decarboxylating 6-phosphogluconate dehydrogenase [Gammaproteobacteria bacterium]|nr:decarboxylating 6-phosphogluconate dehydrogenase [Gammaproteobacteria bacterium]